MAVQAITTGRPVRRPAPTVYAVLTPNGHGYLDGLHGLAARPAPFGSRGGQYLAGYLDGVRATCSLNKLPAATLAAPAPSR